MHTLLGDISELFNIPLQPNEIGGFKTFCSTYRYMTFLNFTHPLIQSLGLNPYGCVINAGVFVIDIDRWREHQITEKVITLMEMNTKEHIFSSNDVGGFTQPPLLIAVSNLIAELPTDWHINGLGGTKEISFNLTELVKAKLWHWNGKLKPWITSAVGSVRQAAFRDLWLAFCNPEPLFSTKVATNSQNTSSAAFIAATVTNVPPILDEHLWYEEFTEIARQRGVEFSKGIMMDCQL